MLIVLSGGEVGLKLLSYQMVMLQSTTMSVERQDHSPDLSRRAFLRGLKDKVIGSAEIVGAAAATAVSIAAENSEDGKDS
jgi:hypothetical protein